MKSNRVVFKDNYGILALAAFPDRTYKTKENLWKSSNLKLELTYLLKRLPQRKDIYTDKA